MMAAQPETDVPDCISMGGTANLLTLTEKGGIGVVTGTIEGAAYGEPTSDMKDLGDGTVEFAMMHVFLEGWFQAPHAGQGCRAIGSARRRSQHVGSGVHRRRGHGAICGFPRHVQESGLDQATQRSCCRKRSHCRGCSFRRGNLSRV